MSNDHQPGESSLIVQLHHGLTRAQLTRAWHDLRAGWAQRELWMTLGLQDVRQRYRRSKLGPFWITLSMAIMVLALGLLYGQIFGQDLHDYLPFLAAGFVIWNLIATLVNEGCQAFILAEGMIRQLNAPLSIYVYRVLWSALIGFAHNIWVFLLVAFWFGVRLDWHLLWVPVALFAILLNGFWAALFFGVLSARFRDVPLVISSLMQLLFFITPVIWRPEMLPGRALWLHLNPFYHLVEIMRAPLLGQAPALANWLPVILVTLGGWALATLFYSAYRWRIAYWV
ncbi:ABC transporter permease [Caldichromatium japonicum]|uniref:ABC transporter permease n=1 Tax=Caldichromatium japonicum TaxID=2699430 RepID=A0A6G7V9M3_9GAMM|nr:ABC transporter permease [Caldichromatium japonicum]QIK36721.1 ABC transporter permease [Caldichromatium japonicum]